MAAALFCAVSCSVKEDRTDCPCRLAIDVSPCARQAETVSLKGWASHRPVFGGELYVADWPEAWEVAVPRGFVGYTAYTGLGGCVLSGADALIPEGEECGPLWACRDEIDCRGEEAHGRVLLHKRHARLTVTLADAPAGALEALFTGATAGTSLEDLSPVRGTFRRRTPQEEDGSFAVTLPAQADDGLLLELLSSGEHFETFPAGEMITRSGYDWGAEDLDDIFLLVDFCRAAVTVTAEGWEEGFTYEFEI